MWHLRYHLWRLWQRLHHCLLWVLVLQLLDLLRSKLYRLSARHHALRNDMLLHPTSSRDDHLLRHHVANRLRIRACHVSVNAHKLRLTYKLHGSDLCPLSSNRGTDLNGLIAALLNAHLLLRLLDNDMLLRLQDELLRSLPLLLRPVALWNLHHDHGHNDLFSIFTSELLLLTRLNHLNHLLLLDMM